ncbi:MAG: hypothetical protein C0514_04280 [Candidatus Puniceispirillum sp.]|nr:hypothetical protein [Candidatus Puniceispirillum sp.]
MSQDMQIPPQAQTPITPVLFGEAVKVGFLFPFKMDKAKALVMLEFLAVVTLAMVGYLKALPVVQTFFEMPDHSAVNPLGDTEGYLLLLVVSYALLICAMLAGIVYTMQCVGLGGTHHPFLLQVCTSTFWRSILLGIMYMLCFIAVIVLGVVLAVKFSGFTTLVTIPAFTYLLGRLMPLFPHVALRNKIDVKKVWRLSQGHVLKILFAPLATYLLIIAGAIGVGIVLGVATLSVSALNPEVTTPFEVMLHQGAQENAKPVLAFVMVMSLFFAALSWIVMGMYATLAHLWRRILENAAGSL